MAHYPSQSPPPLRHPVPTHPAYIPEPPSTPGSPQGYQRFSSSPAPPNQPAHPGYPSHVPAYSAPFQQTQPSVPPQGHMSQPHFQRPEPNQQGSAFQPDFGAWGIDGATANLGMQLGQSAVAAGQQYVQKNFGTMFPTTTLKHHFNVSNSYVMHKIRLVLFPWTHKPWTRRVRRTEHGQHEWLPPRDDLNSPDLYIPVMAIVTYILLTGLHAGLKEAFRPQILGETLSRAALVVLFDFAFIRLGCYILNIQGSTQFVDFFAYSGYKFVGVILTLTAGFLGLSGPLWTIVFLYSYLANAFFLLRSLRSVVLPDPSISIAQNPSQTTTVSEVSRRRRVTLLFLVSVMQIIYMGALVRLPTVKK
ncbi:protein transporter yif1 [Coprinopsis cinerea okayama7|uniref:Protein YIF1 n=1 Tax=Coprinopsis cinerea (strain Okayama-7 / 130 / ATCC MYA-4618 / FGSC 9003) TaxID=240176 RepID=A8NLY4_COPC7|nr:protein transporter yif1 [Coprinopsis cinerea okayama7\|eukprot:XP_001834801.2 protein transporter yif1 [Coprinopsis cinerea okayama7\